MLRQKYKVTVTERDKGRKKETRRGKRWTFNNNKKRLLCLNAMLLLSHLKLAKIQIWELLGREFAAQRARHSCLANERPNDARCSAKICADSQATILIFQLLIKRQLLHR